MQDIGDFAVPDPQRAPSRSRSRRDGLRAAVGGVREAEEKALGHRRADLTVSGRMLNDMGVVAVTERSSRSASGSQGAAGQRRHVHPALARVGAADKAFFHVTGNHGIVRDFFGSLGRGRRADRGRSRTDVERRMARCRPGAHMKRFGPGWAALMIAMPMFDGEGGGGGGRRS
jgi:hypothetical protein